MNQYQSISRRGSSVGSVTASLPEVLRSTLASGIFCGIKFPIPPKSKFSVTGKGMGTKYF